MSGISLSHSSDTNPVLEVDPESGAAYLRLSSAEIVATYAISDNVNVDVAARGVVVGMELLSLDIVELTDEMVSGRAPADPPR